MKRHLYPVYTLSHRWTGFLLLLLIAVPALTSAQSVLVTIAEEPGQQSSTLSGTSVFDFDSLSSGYSYDVQWQGVGSFDELYVASGGTVFGAYDESTGRNSNFNWNGGNWTYTTTLELDQASSYLGLYWAAGDGNDLMNFYNGSDLVASYTTSSIVRNAALTQDYYGDPNSGRNTREPYAFVNFYGDEETAWDRVELTQTSAGSGFETDNITVREAAFDPETDSVEDLGRVVSEISGGIVSDFDPETTTSWVWVPEQTAPGAPTPPIYALILFGVLLIAKDKVSKFRSDA